LIVSGDGKLPYQNATILIMNSKHSEHQYIVTLGSTGRHVKGSDHTVVIAIVY